MLWMSSPSISACLVNKIAFSALNAVLTICGHKSECCSIRSQWEDKPSETPYSEGRYVYVPHVDKLEGLSAALSQNLALGAVWISQHVRNICHSPCRHNGYTLHRDVVCSSAGDDRLQHKHCDTGDPNKYRMSTGCHGPHRCIAMPPRGIFSQNCALQHTCEI